MKTYRKNHKSMSLGRIGLIFVTLLLLGSVLVGCAGQKTTTGLTVNKESIVATEDNQLTVEQLTLLADNIKDSKYALTVREQLVAALNGYDMSVEGFDDNNLPTADPDRAAEFALNVLKRYEITTYESTDAMTRADLQTLVNAFKTTVDTQQSLGFLDRLLTWIALGFEWMINVLGFGSFILGTFVFAIVVEILLLPLAIHQQKNARKQARLRPKEMAIRKKYDGRTDQATMQKMQKEIQDMYQQEGYSPMSSGCLPLLVTLPIVYALYFVVIDPLKYMMSCPSELASALNTFATAPKAAGGLGLSLQSTRGTIEILSHLRELGGVCPESLSGFQYFTNSGTCYETLSGILSTHTIPNFNLGTVNFGMTPSIGSLNLLLLIPVLTFGVYFGSMKLNRKFSYQPTTAGDPGMGCSNTIMDVSMPALSAFFTFMVPGAVGVYWMFKSLLTTLKQFIMSKVMPLPTFTDADYKAAEKELSAKEKGRPVKKNNSGTKNPNVRSLHHIDDDEYENVPSQPTKGRKGISAPEEEDDRTEAETPGEAATEAAGTNDSTYADGVTLKEDRPEDDRDRKKKKKKDASDES